MAMRRGFSQSWSFLLSALFYRQLKDPPPLQIKVRSEEFIEPQSSEPQASRGDRHIPRVLQTIKIEKVLNRKALRIAKEIFKISLLPKIPFNDGLISFLSFSYTTTTMKPMILLF